MPQIYGDMKRVPASILAMLNMLRSYYFSEEMDNVTLLKTLSNSRKYQLNMVYSLLAQLIDIYVVLPSDVDAMEKIDLEKSFWDILKAVGDPQDLIDVFKVLH